ncbi:DUF1403 family protein [Mesorhizobium sp. M0036]|uniref:DUF1403 family protein n=1 Tax=Mesorhizobium sp. M0036 TaxID=2956853 RepID=UPI0033378AD4
MAISLHRASHPVDGDSAWLAACNLAYARGAASVADFYVDVGRRLEKLLGAAERRQNCAARTPDTMVTTLMREDAQPATRGAKTSDRSGRRLFERAGGARRRSRAHRPAFRLYGL